MTTTTLSCSLANLPATKTPQVDAGPKTSSWDLDIYLPRWERHPSGRNGREIGRLGEEWIRINLP